MIRCLLGLVLTTGFVLVSTPTSASPQASESPEVRTPSRDFTLSVNWPRDVAVAPIKVQPKLMQGGSLARGDTFWTLRNYERVNGSIVDRIQLDATVTKRGKATLKSKYPPMGGYFIVEAQLPDIRVTVSARALYRCDRPDSCTLRKRYPTRVEYWPTP